MAKFKDQYDQFFFMDCTMSAANVLTFSKLSIGVSLFDYAAFILSRIEYHIERASLKEIIADTDEMNMAITGTDSITSLDMDQSEVYDSIRLKGWLSGVAATGDIKEQPYIHDFSNMSGGGLLVPAQDMYLAAESTGFAGAGVGQARVYFRIIKLVAQDFLELVQRLRVLRT